MKKRNLFIITLIFSMILNTNLAFNLHGIVIADTTDSSPELVEHWGQKIALSLNDRGIIEPTQTENGVDFNLDQKITRAEFVSALVKSQKYELLRGKVKKFSDVKSSDWFKKDIDIATSNGIISGYPDKTFRPYDEIRRAEIAAIIVKINNWTTDDINRRVSFDDINSSDWFYTVALITKSKEIFTGYTDNTFRPYITSTRAEAFAVINNLLNLGELDEPNIQVPAAGGLVEENTIGGEPQIDNPIILTESITQSSVILNWDKANDDETLQENLEYAVYLSQDDNLKNVADILENGTVASSLEKDINSKLITGLNSGNTYYFAVIVRDEEQNISAYSSVLVNTLTFTSSGGGSRNRTSIPTPTPFAGYNNINELKQNEVEGVDYRISSDFSVEKDITLFSIHAGGISKGISDLMNRLIESGEYNYYLFEGLKEESNSDLRITSTVFDEEQALDIVANSPNTVALIAAQETEKIIFVGGKNKLLSRLITLHLEEDGFIVKYDEMVPSRIAGILNSNIVNKNKLLESGFKIGGSQVSISRGLRDEFEIDKDLEDKFINSMNKALSDSWKKASKVIDDLNLE